MPIYAVSPLDYEQYGPRVGHHRTLPPAVEPGGEFLQLLKLRRRVDDLVAKGPNVLIVHFRPGAGITAFWFGEDDLRLASQLVGECERLPPERWDDYLDAGRHAVHLVHVETGVISLAELIGR